MGMVIFCSICKFICLSIHLSIRIYVRYSHLNSDGYVLQTISFFVFFFLPLSLLPLPPFPLLLFMITNSTRMTIILIVRSSHMILFRSIRDPIANRSKPLFCFVSNSYKNPSPTFYEREKKKKKK